MKKIIPIIGIYPYRVGLILLFLTLEVLSVNAQSPGDYYLFSYFTGNGEDGLHLAWSKDGMKWEALNGNKSFLTPTVGKDKLMRDPCIISGIDGKYHMVWTVSWHERGIGYASSNDLLNWSEQKYIHEPEAKNCWAPEIFYDDSIKMYLIFWSTTIPGRFPDTEKVRGDNNHRIHYTTTADFETFTPTRLLYKKGFNVIDGSIIKKEHTYVLLLKDETVDPPEKNIRIAASNSSTGNYSAPSDPITGDYWAEGPTSVKIGEKYVVYFDKYRDHKMGAVCSADLKIWEDISDQVLFPEGTRHGSVLKVSKNLIEQLKKVR